MDARNEHIMKECRCVQESTIPERTLINLKVPRVHQLAFEEKIVLI